MDSIQESDSMDLEIQLALEEAFLEAGVPLSSSLYPSALLWMGDSYALVACRLKNWLASTRRRTRTTRTTSLSLGAEQQAALTNLARIQLGTTNTEIIVEDECKPPSSVVWQDVQGLSLQERLKKSVELDINSASFTWETLVSLHHTEHAPSSSNGEDDLSKPLEVTVNSGGVVFFALFKDNSALQIREKEAAAVLKFTASSLVTQSERLGNELAKHMGVLCPQSRVIYKSSPEWRELQESAEQCLAMASSSGGDDSTATCNEFLEALNLSQCVLLMGYVKGCPFLNYQTAFETQAAAQGTATALARIFLLDLVLRNEDRLHCSELGWRGNPANLLCTEEMVLGHKSLGRLLSPGERAKAWQSIDAGERKYASLDSLQGLQSCDSFLWRTAAPPKENATGDAFYLVTIDSGVPRRPPAGMRAMDRVTYPKVIELVLNSTEYAARLLHDISGGNLGFSSSSNNGLERDSIIDHIKVVKAFQAGLRTGIRDMQNLHIFLLKLYRMLQIGLQKFFQSINELSPREDDEGSDMESRQSPSVELNPSDSLVSSKKQYGKSDLLVQESKLCVNLDSPRSKRTPEKLDAHGTPQLHKQLTQKLKDVNRTAKVDTRLNEELKRWSEIIDSEGHLFCQNHGFVTGFLEGGPSHSVIRNYEFKVRLEHVLERMNLVSQGADTERPSKVMDSLYIGGALAAKSSHTLQYIGITHVLCLCPTDLKSFGEEFNQSVHYKEIEVLDQETADISCIFKEACDFISGCESSGGKCLVHCFEGRSRSATVVLSYLMTNKHLCLSDAWNLLKAAHHRVQPNDGFMQALMGLEKQLHGVSSMEWQKKRPTLKICQVCGKTAGLSLSSLKNHMDRFHSGGTNNSTPRA